MPNHVTNIIRLRGDEQEIRKMMDTIKNNEFGIGSISFEKIIPMPENVFRGNLGQAEQELYGKNNWYDWSIANWDTKWDAYGFESLPEYDGGNEIRFLTEWSAPHSVLQKLSEMFPKAEISHSWADEDIGHNCGSREYFGGEQTDEYIPGSDQEALEFAVDIIGYDLNDSTEEQESEKPSCPLIGADGNIFNLMGIASRTLRQNDMTDQARISSPKTCSVSIKGRPSIGIHFACKAVN